MNPLEKLKEYLVGRQMNYRAVFNPEGAPCRKVLKDLARFCRADQSTFHENERLHAVLEGRREVWLRIMSHLNLSTDQFLEKYGGKEDYE